MRTYECTQCGGTVPFQSSITVAATCPYCRSLVVRHDARVESIGVQAELPPDLSPLRVGTRGEFDGLAFVLVGRVRVAYEGGSWNEWCADFGEGRWGWIAEAQGFYMASFEIAAPSDLPGAAELAAALKDPPSARPTPVPGVVIGRAQLPVGRRLTLQGQEFEVRDVKESRILGSEGELPFVPQADRAALSADLGGTGRAFANVEYSNDGLRVFVGRYCHFEELKFQELRPVPGWTEGATAEPTRRETQALSCPKCGAAVELRAAGMSMTAICGSCRVAIDTSNPELRLIDRARRKQTVEPQIPLGTRGKFEGRDFECIAFLRRRDSYGDSWSEYLLFNPWAGFRWLVTYQGHWSWVTSVLELPRVEDDQAFHDGRRFRLFARAQAEVTYIIGEVYWRMREKEVTQVSDFVDPPWALSREQYPDLAEETWSLGEYVEATVVQAAFRLPEALPTPTGPYLNQPNPHRAKGRSLRRWVPVVLGIFLLTQWLTYRRHDSETVLQHEFRFDPGDTNRVRLSPEFVITGNRPQAVSFRTTAGVDNNWVEVSYDLIRTDTHEVRELQQTVEYYSGYDGGEAWNEGSSVTEDTLPSVPPGRYLLAAELANDPAKPLQVVQLQVVRDVPVWSNFVLGLILLLLYPAYRWLREHAFERTRWSVSDHSPYTPILEASGDDD